MQSLYNSSVIKAGSAKLEGQVLIKTKEEVPLQQEAADAAHMTAEEFKNYEKLANSILNKSRMDRERILEEAYKEAAVIEKEAYLKGYEEGKANGYEDGYKESYEKHMEKARLEAKQLADNASAMLLSAKAQYESYLKEKEANIVALAVSIAENILCESLESQQGLNKLVQEAIEASKNTKSYIIKCNSIHAKELQQAIDSLKHSLVLRAEIYLVEDNNLTPGNAVIEKDNGRVELGLDIALKSLREEFKL